MPPDDDAGRLASPTEGSGAGERPWELRLREALVDAAHARRERQRCVGRNPHA